MQRKTFLALTGGALLTTIGRWRALAQEEKVQPQTKRAKTYTPQKPRELPDSTSTRPTSPMGMAFRNSSANYALVSERPGIRIYSPRANEIHAVAFSGSVEWVGTATDIKRVDRERNIVRVYSEEDGLPLGVAQQLVGDEKEAFALVVGSNGKTFLCALDASTDRWESFPVSGYQGGRSGSISNGTDFLVLGKDKVAFVPWYAKLRGDVYGRSEGGSPTPFMLFDRRTRKLLPGSWDPAIETDHPHLEIRSAAIVGETLWLGTQIGVVGASLTIDEEETPPLWRRWLPTRSIKQGTLLPDGRLVVSSVGRLNGSSEPLLETLDLKTGKHQPLPMVPGRNLSGQFLTSALLATADGELWQISPSRSDFSPEASLGPEVWRLSLEATAWENVIWSDAKPGMRSPVAPPPKLVEEKTLPDPVAGILVCRLREGRDIRRGFPFQSIGQGPWLTQRFWRWRTPDISDELPLETLFSQGPEPMPPTLRDSENPELVWLMEGGAFVRLPQRELPAPGAEITTARAQRFLVEQGAALRAVRVTNLLAGATPLAIGIVPGTLLRLLPGGSAVPTKLPEAQVVGGFLATAGTVAGPRQTRFIAAFAQGKRGLYRWDEKKETLLETGVMVDPNSNGRLGGTRQGIWRPANSFSSSQKTLSFSFRAVDAEGMLAAEWKEIEIEVPADQSAPRYFDTGADVLWFQENDSQKGLTIWNPATRQWSASGVLHQTGGSSFFRESVVEGTDGVGWLYSEGSERVLVGYDIKNNRWEKVTLPAPATQQAYQGFIAAATESTVWVVYTGGVWRYDRKAKTWSKPEKAQKGFTPDQTMFSPLPKGCVPGSRGGWWVGSFQGLWNFNPETGAWREITERANVEGRNLRLSLSLADAVWGQADSVLVRLDRKKGKARVFGRESMPTLGNLGELRSGGGCCWIIGQRPHYFDASTERFIPLALPVAVSSDRPFSCSAVATVPGSPQTALMLLQSGGESALYRWEKGTLDPTPFPQPEGMRRLYDLRLMGSSLYLAGSDGIWRYDAKGRWEQLETTIFSRLLPDKEKLGVLWAISAGIGMGGEMATIARIETG